MLVEHGGKLENGGEGGSGGGGGGGGASGISTGSGAGNRRCHSSKSV